MQRDFGKPNCPGFWESGAGGSVLKGEDFEAAAKRELEEETGIISENFIENYWFVTHDTIYKGYVCITDVPKDSVTLQEGETIDYKWVKRDEFLEIFESDKFPFYKRERLRDFAGKMDNYEGLQGEVFTEKIM